MGWFFNKVSQEEIERRKEDLENVVSQIEVGTLYEDVVKELEKVKWLKGPEEKELNVFVSPIWGASCARMLLWKLDIGDKYFPLYLIFLNERLVEKEIDSLVKFMLKQRILEVQYIEKLRNQKRYFENDLIDSIENELLLKRKELEKIDTKEAKEEVSNINHRLMKINQIRMYYRGERGFLDVFKDLKNGLSYEEVSEMFGNKGSKRFEDISFDKTKGKEVSVVGYSWCIVLLKDGVDEKGLPKIIGYEFISIENNERFENKLNPDKHFVAYLANTYFVDGVLNSFDIVTPFDDLEESFEEINEAEDILLQSLFDFFSDLKLGLSKDKIVEIFKNSDFDFKYSIEDTVEDGITLNNITWYIEENSDWYIKTTFINSELKIKKQKGLYKRVLETEENEDEDEEGYDIFLDISLGDTFEDVKEKIESIFEVDFFEILSEECFLDGRHRLQCVWSGINDNNKPLPTINCFFIDNALALKEQVGYGDFFEVENNSIIYEELSKKLTLGLTYNEIINIFVDLGCLEFITLCSEELYGEKLDVVRQVYWVHCIIEEEEMDFLLYLDNDRLVEIKINEDK